MEPTLHRDRYVEADWYAREVSQVFGRQWFCVGRENEIPGAGDHLVCDVAGESIIVTRTRDGGLSAYINLCRHRGSRICDAARGHESRLTCRYHGWTYGLDGSLKAAARVGEDFDRSKWGLRRLAVRVFEGMIFVNFDERPSDFSEFEREMGPALRPYGLDRAKVALKRNYPIASNWKLAIENYCECYHCQPAHPEYSVGHGRALPDAECSTMLSEVLDRAPGVGLTTHTIRRSWLRAPAFGLEHGFDRYPLLRGQQTGSRDGKAVAPLLGTITGYDGGTTDVHLGPLTFALAYCDHVVVYRFAPRGQYLTDCEITWLVNETAVEGRDYRLADLTWLWDVTTIADKRIIERNQRGVDSRYYAPGPLSAVMETFTQEFIDWVVETLRRATGGGLPGRRPVANIRKTAEGRT